MNNIVQRIRVFRTLIEQTISAQKGKTDKYARGIASVCNALLADYDTLFDPTLMEGAEESISSLIAQYCYPDPRCPVCGHTMVIRTSDRGKFKGCPMYPDCRGTRNLEGKVSINDFLILYLSDKQYEDTLKTKEEEDSRFRNLDL